MTLQELQDRLASYLAAERRILESQEYSSGSGSTARKNRRADLESVQTEIARLRSEIGALQNVAARTRRVRYIRAV